MELWDVYDADRRLTGRTMVRGERFQPGDYQFDEQRLLCGMEKATGQSSI